MELNHLFNAHQQKRINANNVCSLGRNQLIFS